MSKSPEDLVREAVALQEHYDDAYYFRERARTLLVELADALEAATDEVHRFKDALERIQGMAGAPSAAEACRTIIRFAGNVLSARAALRQPPSQTAGDGDE